MTTMNDTLPVLIAGAGPTGLVLALCLARRKIPVRIIDSKAGPSRESRAMAVQARTLEFYRQLGFADDVAERGLKVGSAQFRRYGKQVAHFHLGEMGGDISPYPFMLSFPQDEHEAYLIERLAAVGVEIEWATELLGLSQDEGSVTASLRGPHGQETIEAPYVCGCDGGHSTVRRSLDIGFSGGTTRGLFYVADVELEGGFTPDVQANIDDRGIAMNFPVRPGQQRLIGMVPTDLVERSDLGFADLRPWVEPLLGVRVVEVHWFSTYHVSHRVADHFRVGRCFLSGDAGHVHSPVGGQGMNTGIGDAVNLAWRIADVLLGRISAEVLDTYEPERIAFARALVSTTDQVFQRLVSRSRLGAVVRYLAPSVINFLARFEVSRRMLFRTVSQVRVEYRKSALSEGISGEVAGGDRLPWTGENVDNYAPLTSLDWQLHVMGSVDPTLARVAEAAKIPVHAWPWQPSHAARGFAEDGALLVRPDGYVALALAQQDPRVLQTYLARWKLGAGRASPRQPG